MLTGQFVSRCSTTTTSRASQEDTDLMSTSIRHSAAISGTEHFRSLSASARTPVRGKYTPPQKMKTKRRTSGRVVVEEETCSRLEETAMKKVISAKLKVYNEQTSKQTKG